MNAADLTASVRAELADENISARLAEQRRQDAQRTCEECGDVEADYRVDVEQHMCADCYLEIECADADDHHNDPRRA